MAYNLSVRAILRISFIWRVISPLPISRGKSTGWLTPHSSMWWPETAHWLLKPRPHLWIWAGLANPTNKQSTTHRDRSQDRGRLSISHDTLLGWLWLRWGLRRCCTPIDTTIMA